MKIPADTPPAKRLGRTPRCKCEADIDTALAELGWIQSRTKTVRGILESAIAAAQADAEPDLTIEGVPFAQRAAALEQAIRDYATDHRDEFVVGDSKTRAFAHGKVAFRVRPPVVRPAEGQSPTSLLKRLAGDFAAKATAWLRRSKLAPWIRLKAEVDFPGLKAEVAAGRLTPEELEERGLVYDADREEVHIDASPCLGE